MARLPSMTAALSAAVPQCGSPALVLPVPHCCSDMHAHPMRWAQVLELHPQGALMSAAQLRRAGQLPLNELRLESHAFRQSSAITNLTPSHVDDRGVRALVDSICRRWRIDSGGQGLACASELLVGLPA